MKYILITVFAIGVMGIFFKENILQYTNQQKQTLTNLEQEKNNAKKIILHIKGAHADLKNKKCYFDGLGLSSGLNNITEPVKIDSFYISYSPITYYCMKKADPRLATFAGHEIMTMNVVFEDLNSNVLNGAELEQFKETLRNVRRAVHDLNSSKGLQYYFNDYDIVIPSTIAWSVGGSYSLREIEVMKSLMVD